MSGCPGGGIDTATEATQPTESAEATPGTPPTTGDTEATTNPTTDGTDTTEITGGLTTSETTGDPSVECPMPVPAGQFTFFGDDQAIAVNFTEDCSEVEFPALHEEYATDKFMAGVYRPDVGGDWPDQVLPLLVFGHGNGHRYYGYDELFMELTKLGFVVISLDFRDNLDVKTRGEQILCSSRWFANTWAESSRLDGNLIFAGHSRGGEAVAIAMGLRDSLDSPLDTFDLRATLSIAPSTFLDFKLPDYTDPFLVIQGSTDEDTTHGAIKLYEKLGIEQIPPTKSPGKWMVWLYDIAHGDYGGKCSTPPPMKKCLGSPKGRAAARNLFSSFLQWHVFGQSSFRHQMVGSYNAQTRHRVILPLPVPVPRRQCD